MDTISSLITHINLESLPTSTPTTTKEPPDILNTLTGDVPPPHFMTSINQLRRFSTALSSFISRYDELHSHLNFINSSIDSKLSNHLVETTNPNQSAIRKVRLLETFCDQMKIDLPEVSLSERNPKESGSDCERSHEEIDTSEKPETVDVSKNSEEIAVSGNPVEIATTKTLDEIDVLNLVESDTCKKHEETVLETSCDQTTTAVPEAVVLEHNPNGMAAYSQQSHENVSKKPEVTDILNKPEEIGILEKTAQTDICRNAEVIDVLQKPEEIDTLMNTKEPDTSKTREEIDVPKKVEETDVSNVETDIWKKHVETVSETSCDDQTITADAEAIISEQNSNGMAANCEQSRENVRTPESLEEIDIWKNPVVIDVAKKPEQTDIMKHPQEIDILKKPEQADICKNPEESVVSKKPEETVPETSCDQTTPALLEQNRNRMAANHEQSHENASKKPEQIYICKKLEQTDICKNLSKIDTSKKPAVIDTLKKSVISVLESSCQNMRSKEMRWHIAKHFSQMINHRKEIAKALKLAEDPAKLVLSSIGRFFIQDSKTYCNPHQNKQDRRRMAAVLILECFVMISGDGIEIAKREQKCAAKAAVDWRNRIIKEGGFGHTDEVDARGLLLLISGFGFQEHVFTIQDIMDLIRASNVKGISTALRRSVFLIPKIPKVINWMVQSNIEIEAVDIAYTFGLEDMCHPQNILATYLHNKTNDFQNSSSLEMLEAAKQHLFDLKSVRQCLESHNIDPSTLLPDFKINEQIQNIEKEVNKGKLIQKRKSLENPIHQEPKRACFSHENATAPESLEESNVSNKPEEFDNLLKPGQTDICKNPEETVVLKKPEELDNSIIPEEIDTSEKPEETVLETCIQTTTAVPEAIVSEQNSNRMAANCNQSHEHVRTPESLEEFDVQKKPEETVPETSYDQTTPAVSKQNPNRMANNREQSHENVSKKPAVMDVSKKPAVMDVSKKPAVMDVSKKPEQTDICKNLSEIDTLKKPAVIDTSKKSVISVLESLCQSMRPKDMKWHVAEHLSEMSNLRVEIANALKLAEDPANFVINSIGRFFTQKRRTFLKGLGPHHEKENRGRKAAVLILECFVMISSDDGIEIANRDQESAAQAAVVWKKRMIKEGGLGHADEVDARGLLLLISGFGIQDHVFKIQDIVDLIRACNVKGISTALCHSVFLIPKIPEVIYLMVKSNLEIKAVDIAYTFGLEDACHSRNILTTYLEKIKSFQNSLSSEKLEAVKQHLLELKLLKKCLESHNVDPSTLLPDFKIDEMIQNLEKEVNERKSIRKRKSSENPMHQKAKRACVGHENMPHQQKPVNHYGMNQSNRSTQTRTGCFDSDRNLGNSYITNHSPSYVYNAYAMPKSIVGPVPNSVAGGFPGSYDQAVHMGNAQPYGWHGPYVQQYLRHGQTYDSQPYHGPWGRGELASFPAVPGRPVQSSGLYGFADIVEKESRRSHA